MQVRQFSIWTMTTVLAACCGTLQAQTPTPQTTQPATTTPAPTKPRVRRKTVQPAASVQRIPLETTPASPPPTPAAEAQQKAADAKLLQQQQQQSAQAAQITNQQVQTAQKQKDAIQNEVRIQDAPGPVQTGVVPAAGPPVAPVNPDQRIQDAPGPAQTLPPLPTPAATPPPQ